MIKTLGFGWDSAVRPLQYLMLAGLLAMGFGFDLGRTFANQQVLSNYFILEGHEADVILGTDILGAILGLFLGGWLVYGSGRKICLLSGSAAGMAGSAAALFAPNLSIMLCAQFVTGFAAGLFTLSLLLYAAEITLPKNRGLGCSMGMTCFAAGALIGVLTCDIGPARGSTALSLVIIFISLGVLIAAAFKLPESPRYLSSIGQPDSALNVLFKLRGNMGLSARELAGINECYRQEQRGSQFFLQSAPFRRVFWVLLGLTLLLQASGFSAMLFALDDLFAVGRYLNYYQSSGFTYGLLKAAFAVAFFGFITAALMIDRLGRRTLLFAAACLLAFALLVLAFSSFAGRMLITPLLLTLGVLSYIYASVICFSVLIGCLMPELCPGRGREFAAAAILLCQAVAALFALQSYTQLVRVLGYSGLFCCFLLAALLFCLLIWHYVPNTAQASLEGIENRLLEGERLRNLGRVRD